MHSNKKEEFKLLFAHAMMAYWRPQEFTDTCLKQTIMAKIVGVKVFTKNVPFLYTYNNSEEERIKVSILLK